MEYFRYIGFERHPFAQTNADEEPQLNDYFVPPPFFDAVIGDPERPSASVVLAPRGGGKSAQRRRIEYWSIENQVLAVTYDRFEFNGFKSLDEINLSYHLRNIIMRTLIAVLSYLAEYQDVVTNFDKDTRSLISNMASSYLGDMTGTTYKQLLKELRGIPNRIKEFWNRNIGTMNLAATAILAALKLPKATLSKFDEANIKLDKSRKFQLSQLYDITKNMGFKSIYILIDKIDETELTGNNPEKAYQLIAPLIRDLDLLSLNGYGFKFFIWDKLFNDFVKDARPDRVSQFQLEWHRTSLEKVLSKRVKTFSGNKINELNQICDTDTFNTSVDTIAAILSNRSPRNMIRFCQKVLAAQAEIDAKEQFLTLEAIDKASILFSEEITNERYGSQVCKDLLRTNRGTFTINYLANNIFRTEHINTSRNKVTKWISLDLVQQIGTITLPTSPKPVNLYIVKDPAMLRLIYSTKSIVAFFDDLWIPCNYCSNDNLIDLSEYPKDSGPVCAKCGRELF